MEISLGTDFASDLRGYDRGWDALRKVLCRRLVTPRGSLFYDANFGMDVRAWINEGITTQKLWELTTFIQREMEKDERVEAAVVTATPTTDALKIKAQIYTAQGQFALVVKASKLRVDILVGGGDERATRVINA